MLVAHPRGHAMACNGEDNNAGEHKEDCGAAGDVVSAGEDWEQ